MTDLHGQAMAGRTFEQQVDQDGAMVQVLGSHWRPLMVRYTMSVWAEAEDRRCGPEGLLRSFMMTAAARSLA